MLIGCEMAMHCGCSSNGASRSCGIITIFIGKFPWCREMSKESTSLVWLSSLLDMLYRDISSSLSRSPAPRIEVIFSVSYNFLCSIKTYNIVYFPFHILAFVCGIQILSFSVCTKLSSIFVFHIRVLYISFLYTFLYI